MAEITDRRTGELVQGVLRILSHHPDGLPASRVLAELEREVPPTPFEASDYPNRPGDRRYEKTVRFMTINAVKAGWLVKETRRISLLGLSQLFDLWVEHYGRLDEETRQLLPLKPVYFLAARP